MSETFFYLSLHVHNNYGTTFIADDELLWVFG